MQRAKNDPVDELLPEPAKPALCDNVLDGHSSDTPQDRDADDHDACDDDGYES